MRFCTGDGVVGGVIGVNVLIDRSMGDGNPVCRKINGGKYDGLPRIGGTRN